MNEPSHFRHGTLMEGCSPGLFEVAIEEANQSCSRRQLKGWVRTLDLLGRQSEQGLLHVEDLSSTII